MNKTEQILRKSNVTLKGKGEKNMLFLHGYGCDQNMWRFVSPAFEEDYRLILPDLIGCGKSDISAYNFQKYSTLAGYADDIIEICEALEAKNTILVGHSVSSIIGLMAVQKRPDLFEKLVMIGPSPCYINEGDYYGGFDRKDIEELIGALESNYLGWAAHITPVIAGNPEKPQVAEELHNSFCRNDPKIAEHFAKTTFLGDNRKDLQTVDIPTLIMQCDADVIAPERVGRYVHEQMKNSRFVLLDAAGHCPHLSDPEETVQALRDFLDA